jgi:protein phosphatase
LNVWGLTNRGKVRKENQDAFYAKTITTAGATMSICVICDGMGGVKGGDVASKLAVDAFQKALESEIIPLAECSELLHHAVAVATEKVIAHAKAHPAINDMGTTLVAALINVKGEAAVVNIGDSRCYLLRCGEDGSYGIIEQITKDHSHVEDMVDAGELRREEARFHPARNYITRAISLDALTTPDFFELKLNSGDILLLCSDGLSNELDPKEIAYELMHGDIDTAAQRCLNIALTRGAPDNVTVVIFQM